MSDRLKQDLDASKEALKHVKDAAGEELKLAKKAAQDEIAVLKSQLKCGAQAGKAVGEDQRKKDS